MNNINESLNSLTTQLKNIMKKSRSLDPEQYKKLMFNIEVLKKEFYTMSHKEKKLTLFEETLNDQYDRIFETCASEYFIPDLSELNPKFAKKLEEIVSRHRNALNIKVQEIIADSKKPIEDKKEKIKEYVKKVNISIEAHKELLDDGYPPEIVREQALNFYREIVNELLL